MGVVHVLVAAVHTGAVAYAILGEAKLPLSATYTWHPIGSALLLQLGTLSLAASQVAAGKKRNSGAWNASVAVHALLNWLSVAALGRGMYAIYSSKEEKGRPHLSTQHAKLGVACIAFLFFNILGGVSIKLSPAAYAKNVKAHRFGGYIAYAVVLANHASALASGYVTKDEKLKVVLWGSLAVQAAFMAAGAAHRLGQLLAKKKAI